MAQIRTINGERHNVKETKEEINSIICGLECVETGILNLNWTATLSGWKNREETTEYKTEPVSFIRTNIMMYY